MGMKCCNFIFLATAHEGGWPALSITVSSSHWQSAVSVLVGKEAQVETEILNQTSALTKVSTPNLTFGSPASLPHTPYKVEYSTLIH